MPKINPAVLYFFPDRFSDFSTLVHSLDIYCKKKLQDDGFLMVFVLWFFTFQGIESHLACMQLYKYVVVVPK